MTRQGYIDAAVAELSDVMSKTDQQIEDDLDRLFDQALAQYSKDSPYYNSEVHTSVEDEYEVTLNNPVFSSSVYVYYEDTDTGIRTPIAVYGVSFDTNKIIFYSPLAYDTITVEYSGTHVVTDESSTIPDVHEYAFLYLLCALEIQYDIYGVGDRVQYVDNGILQVRFGDNTAATSQQVTEGYYTRYKKIMTATASQMVTKDTDDNVVLPASDFGW